MLAAGNTMYLLIPSPSKTRYLFPGKVLQSDAANFTAQFEDPISPAVGSDVNAFCEVNGKFFQQGAVVKEINPAAVNVISFSRTGEIVSAENRQAFRVSVVATDISVGVGREKSCPLVDVSTEGFAAITARKVNLGVVVPVSLNGEGHYFETTARVQTVRQRPDGRFRHGFLVQKSNLPARKSLQQLTAAMQRLQLKRIRGAA